MHFRTRYWDRFSMIHRTAVIYHQREFITPFECKYPFKNKASICKTMPSLDGHLVNWFTWFKEGICRANHGHYLQHLAHTQRQETMLQILTSGVKCQLWTKCIFEWCTTTNDKRWKFTKWAPTTKEGRCVQDIHAAGLWSQLSSFLHVRWKIDFSSERGINTAGAEILRSPTHSHTDRVFPVSTTRHDLITLLSNYLTTQLQTMI